MPAIIGECRQADKGEATRRTNLILRGGFLPTLTENAGAVATIKSFTADRLFDGQSKKFFAMVMALAEAADAARRGF